MKIKSQLAIILLGLNFIVACSVTLEKDIPEANRRVLNTVRYYASQKSPNLALHNMISLTKFATVKQFPSSQAILLKTLQELYLAENFEEEATLFAQHVELPVIALAQNGPSNIRLYRFQEKQVQEISLMFSSMEELESRFKNKNLSDNTNFKEALNLGIFDAGKVYFLETSSDSKPYHSK